MNFLRREEANMYTKTVNMNKLDWQGLRKIPETFDSSYL